MSLTTRAPERDNAVPLVSGETSLPYLVYGSLRPMEYNSGVVSRAGGTYGATVVLDGYVMRAAPGAAFPYVTRGDGHVVATVVTPPVDESSRLRLRRDLDALEGFDPARRFGNLYAREAVRFHHASDGLLRWAWIYLVEPERVQGLPVITGGDWLARGH